MLFVASLGTTLFLRQRVPFYAVSRLVDSATVVDIVLRASCRSPRPPQDSVPRRDVRCSSFSRLFRSPRYFVPSASLDQARMEDAKPDSGSQRVTSLVCHLRCTSPTASSLTAIARRRPRLLDRPCLRCHRQDPLSSPIDLLSAIESGSRSRDGHGP